MPEQDEAGMWAHAGTGRSAGGNSQLHADSTTPAAGGQLAQPAHGRIIGTTWRKSARRSLHLLHRPRAAWAVDVADLLAAERCGVQTVELHDQESGAVYRVSLATFKLRGERFDRGHGLQLALPLGYWRVTGDAETPAAETPAEQLSLFG